MKKIIAVFLSVIMVLCLFVPAATALTPAEKAKLQFNKDGSFKIMNLSDIQDGKRLLSITANFIKAAIEAEKPDLIVLTGDNIAGNTLSEEKTETAIRAVMDVLDPYGIPVAIVFGNHDEESGVSKEDQMAIYNQYECSISYDDGEALWGCGTYNIPVYSSSDDTKVVFNCWMFDSGNRDEDGGYDHVKKDQLDWYKAKSAELKAANGGKVVPSIAFQHIIVPEIFEALEETDSSAKGVVVKYGKYYTLPETAEDGSVIGEAPCPAAVNGGEFDAFVECGDVLAVVSGHDHTNSFVVPYKNIDIINTPTCGFRSYGNKDTTGIRIFVIDEKNPSGYETDVITYSELFSDNFFAKLSFNFYGFISGAQSFFYVVGSKIMSLLGIE